MIEVWKREGLYNIFIIQFCFGIVPTNFLNNKMGDISLNGTVYGLSTIYGLIGKNNTSNIPNIPNIWLYIPNI